MQKQRRSVWHWLAEKAGVDVKLTREEWMTAYRIGAANRIEKPHWMTQADYREMLYDHSVVAYQWLVRGHRHEPPVLTVTTYEPPERTTDPTRRVGTYSTSLPAVDPLTGQYIGSGQMARKTEQMRRKSG